MDVGLSVVNLASLATSKVAVAGEVGVEAMDHLASKAEWVQGDILLQCWVKERGSVNVLSWRTVWATLRSNSLHLASSPEAAAKAAASPAADLAKHLEGLPEPQLEALANNVQQQISQEQSETNEDVKMMNAVREYMRKDFVNTVILFKRENEGASFEDFLAASFPENISRDSDGKVDWIDHRVLNEEWQGTFETVQKTDSLFELGNLPAVETDNQLVPQPSGKLSKTWLKLNNFVMEAVRDPIANALTESKTASASFLQNVRDGTHNAIASVSQSIADLKERWIPIEDIQEVEILPNPQGNELPSTRFRIIARDGMMHYLDTETAEACTQFHALLLQCMAASRRTQVLTNGQPNSGLRALRLLRGHGEQHPANAKN